MQALNVQQNSGFRRSRLHFMNAVRHFPGRYSCAIDCFLELWVGLVGRVACIFEGGNEFLDRMSRLVRQYDEVMLTETYSANSFSFVSIREIIWSFLREVCPSISPMDCNAQFSEIFTRRVFGYLSELQKQILISKFTLMGRCERCFRNSEKNIECLIFYVTETMLVNRVNEQWEDLIVDMNLSDSILCSTCNSISLVYDFQPFLSSVLFVELSPGSERHVVFQEQFFLRNRSYRLCAMVRCCNAHFSCSVKRNSYWEFLDDLSNFTVTFHSVSEMLVEIPNGWFFLVFIEENLCDQIMINQVPLREFVNYSVENSSVRGAPVKKKDLVENNKDSVENSVRGPPLKKKRKDNDRQSGFAKDPVNVRNKSNARQAIDKKTASEEAKGFHQSIEMKIYHCTVCYEAWPLRKRSKISKSVYICNRCKRDKQTPKKFSVENDMVPSKVPLELLGLTQCEEMLISRAFPVMLVYTKPGAGYLGYKGHVISLPHNIQHIANVLPILTEDLPIVKFSQSGSINSSDFKVRRQKVLSALRWLVANNPQYRDVTIDMGRIETLPVDGSVDVTLHEVQFPSEKVDVGPNCDAESEVEKEEIETSSFLPTSLDQPNETDRLKETLNQCEMEIDQESPFNEFQTQYLATMCFPCLFPDGKADPTFTGNKRQISAKDSESFSLKLKHLIKFAEFENCKWKYRYASHPRFAFWAYNMLYRKRLLKQGSYYLNQRFDEDLFSINELKEMVETDAARILMNKIVYYAKNVSGTNSYWYQQKNNLKATISQMGAPTIFWTLSCAEFHWPEFHSLLSKTNILELKSAEIRENIVNNHHLLDWFFTERTEAFVRHWLYKTLGAKWHWFRYEFTVNRGSIHCHGLAKLNSDPGLCELSKTAVQGYVAKKKLNNVRISLSTEEREQLKLQVENGLECEEVICNYHDSLMTSCNPVDPNDWVKPDFHPSKVSYSNAMEDKGNDYANLVNSVQRHTKCNSAYCLRVDTYGKQYCRFHFPMESNEKTYIDYQELDKTESNYRAIIISKRNDARVNRHQEVQLQAWRANCDIQLIIDYHACLEYLAKYASKAEKMSSILKDSFASVMSNVKPTTDPSSVIRKLMIKGVGERDMSIQEVMHSILGLKLVSSSFDVINISLQYSKKISFVDGEIILKESPMDVYANRCNVDKDLSRLNLLTFFSSYVLAGNKITKRKTPVVVRTFPVLNSNPSNENYGQYCKFQLLKYKPWSENPSNAWGGQVEETNSNFVTQWQLFLDTDIGKGLVPNWEREVNNVEVFVMSNEESDCAIDNVDQGKFCREEWMYIAELRGHKEKTLVNEKFEVSESDIENFRKNYSPEKITEMAFWLERQKEEHSNVSILSTSNVHVVDIHSLNVDQKLAYDLVSFHFHNIEKPMRMIVTGQGGSGKSYVIDAVRQLLGEKCVVCSYFGLAAFNVNGQTLHSLFQLPIMGRQRKDLQGQALQRLQLKLQGIKYLLIDEFSVIGQKMFGWLDRRCRQATGKMSELFGGLSVLLFGDNAQLPPVSDKLLYHSKPSDDISLQGFIAYREFKLVVKLTKNIRASGKNEKAFRQILKNLRNGESTNEDWKLLQTRNKCNFEKSYLNGYNVKLAYSNEEVAKHNYAELLKLEKPVFVLKGVHNHKKGERFTCNDFGGLESTLYLCEGARVMLTRNLWITYGLCNGSMGYVKHIIYKQNEGPPNLPVSVIVQFDNYFGPSFCETFERCIPITPVLSEIDDSSEHFERLQLPLRLCNAITIHKSQGLTLQNVEIDIGSTEKVAGLSYVALSRVRGLHNLVLEPFSLDRLKAISTTKNFKYRVEEGKRFDDINCNTRDAFAGGCSLLIFNRFL